MKNIIMIVDDDPTARETISAILDGLGHQLEVASNGPEAIYQAEKITPDLILLDVMMPGMDGFSVCQYMREDPRLREVPILLLTALDDRESRLNGLRAGADDFLSKPIDPQELRARVATILRLNRYRTLIDQRENLKEMAERVMNAQEQERLRISREIHDDIGQALTAHQIQLKLLRDNLPTEQEELRNLAQNMVNDANAIFSKLRLLAQDLRPPLIDTLGIVLALKAYCNDFSRRTGLSTNFESDVDTLDLPDAISMTIYRILQESLSNIARHADATQSWVTLNSDEDETCLTIQDNGIGFQSKTKMHKGLGLQGMQERVTMAGGTYNLRSTPGQGTVITVRFPRPITQNAKKAEAS
jgi:signal transduction histidine kinase